MSGGLQAGGRRYARRMTPGGWRCAQLTGHATSLALSKLAQLLQLAWPSSSWLELARPS